MKGAQVRCASVSDHERLRAFTSIYERLRAFASAPGRVWSRLVAFSRVWSRQFFFLVSGHVWACSVISCHIVSYLVVIFRHFSSFFVISRPKFFFRVWRATGGCGTGWAGRAAVCCAWLPRRGQDVHHVMIFVSNWFATAAGPRLCSFMFSTIVLQNRGVCSCWNFQGAFQNGGGFLRCSEGVECTAVIRTLIHAVDMMEAVDGSGSGGVFIHESRRTAVRLCPQATCIGHRLDQFFDRHGNRRLSLGHVRQDWDAPPHGKGLQARSHSPIMELQVRQI